VSEKGRSPSPATQRLLAACRSWEQGSEHQRRLAEDLRAVLSERDEARHLAGWLYEHGGRQVLDASGGGDVSEWPWLTAPAREEP
jgi:hypothetical protein